MKTYICNIDNPSLHKVAVVTDNKLTNVHKRVGKYYCRLNGELMTTSDAKREMLKNARLVNLSGSEIEI